VNRRIDASVSWGTRARGPSFHIWNTNKLLCSGAQYSERTISGMLIIKEKEAGGAKCSEWMGANDGDTRASGALVWTL